MSELIKYVEAKSVYTYLFRVALDRIPDPEERDQISNGIQDAMEQLGVPRDNVATQVFKSDVRPEANTPENGREFVRRSERYLLCILVRSEPGVLQQDPAEISEEAVNAFVKFSRLERENVAAITLENAYLEVEKMADPNRSIVLW